MRLLIITTGFLLSIACLSIYAQGATDSLYEKPFHYSDSTVTVGEFHFLDISWELDSPFSHSATFSMDSLTAFLTLHDSLSIEIDSYTDCMGSAEYNQSLSDARSQRIKDYLIWRGIKPKRVTVKGFGESMPLIPCECDNCTPGERQKNRRTLIVITGT